jgi:hypothetical protein
LYKGKENETARDTTLLTVKQNNRFRTEQSVSYIRNLAKIKCKRKSFRPAPSFDRNQIKYRRSVNPSRGRARPTGVGWRRRGRRGGVPPEPESFRRRSDPATARPGGWRGEVSRSPRPTSRRRDTRRICTTCPSPSSSDAGESRWTHTRQISSFADDHYLVH